MNNKLNSKSLIVCLSILLAYNSCKQLGLEKDEADNSTVAAAAILATRTTTATSTSTSTSTSTNTAPSALAYSGSPYSFTVNTAISAQTPTVTGTITSCTVSPALPTGLTLATATCSITGTPTVAQAATSYTVTATNSFGSTTATISITIAAVGASCTANTSTGTTVLASTATLDATTGCPTNITTCMDSALPAWIKDNFKCAIGYVSGSNYVFKSQNIPNTKSYYFTAYTNNVANTTYPLYEALPYGNTKAGSNTVISQNLTYTIPSTPTRGTGTDSTQGGLVSIGITLNGLAIFNNAAAPPDVLASEATTFDNFQGHPQNSGVYHHHAAVPKVCESAANTSNTGACANAALIGVALDGYAIYGQKCDNGTATTTDDFTPTLDSLHGHTAVTTHFSTATYHYHYANDTTATIYTLMGSFFYGNKGSVSN